ncbi:MAG: hydrogenase maturation protease [Candidatus Omnitrophica bacterium]|nr:hydrogenase maturation protease [Candidatus Omnitrophota bacterium]
MNLSQCRPAISTCVIGIGNLRRGDDGAGIVVIRRLMARPIPNTRFVEAGDDCLALIDVWQGADFVILVDAVCSGVEPGTIYRINPRSQTLPAVFSPTSTHCFSLAETIELARILDRLPPRLLVFGIEGEDFGLGQTMSTRINLAVDEVTREIADEVAPAQTTLTLPPGWHDRTDVRCWV